MVGKALKPINSCPSLLLHVPPQSVLVIAYIKFYGLRLSSIFKGSALSINWLVYADRLLNGE